MCVCVVRCGEAFTQIALVTLRIIIYNIRKSGKYFFKGNKLRDLKNKTYPRIVFSYIENIWRTDLSIANLAKICLVFFCDKIQ